MSSMVARALVWTTTMVGLVACGHTVVVQTEDDGAGGSTPPTVFGGGEGPTAPMSGTSTGAGAGAGTGTGTETGTPAGTGTGTETESCFECTDWLSLDHIFAEDLCGFVSGTGEVDLTCEDDTSCTILLELQTCTCNDCGDLCVDRCTGGGTTMECIRCIGDTCGEQYNACVLDGY